MARPGVVTGLDHRFSFMLRAHQWVALERLAANAGMFEGDLPNRGEWLRQAVDDAIARGEDKGEQGQDTGGGGQDQGDVRSGDQGVDRSEPQAEVRVGGCPKCGAGVRDEEKAPPGGWSDGNLWPMNARRHDAPAVLPLGTQVYCSACSWQGNVWYTQEGGAS